MFKLVKPFEPSGDQPEAIASLVEGFRSGVKRQTLLGVTGSGKTFTMANVIQELQRPTLVLSHNKTLAAQLYDEFKAFFPENAVSYFVSYYDYYQPEAYIPQRDLYIEKDSSINEEIDRLRLLATSSLVSRDDVIVVASVSSIYGLGSPEDYKSLTLCLRVGEEIGHETLLRRLVDIQYDRNDDALDRGRFRVRGDTIDVRLTYEDYAVRIIMWGDEIEKIYAIDPISCQTVKEFDEIYIYPSKHFVISAERIHEAVERINDELNARVNVLRAEGKLMEAQRLLEKTRFDMEMLQETGFCTGIENYSAVLADRAPGEPPETLFDFFPDDFLVIVDESHVTLPQIRAMYAGDQARKKTLVEHGFRLPSALDNRPLKFEEWEERLDKALFVSATPSKYEIEASGGKIVEQAIRPTGLLDPEVEVVPAAVQIPHLYEQIQERVAARERVLVTALTKRLAEDVASYFLERGVKCRWLHSDLDAFERVALLRDLRDGKFDVLVGVNLLREGLDLPEVSLVAILDADKEGFLRNETSLIQTIGRCARNVHAKVILYGDKVTESMRVAISETARRRAIQQKYNADHGIVPHTALRAVKEGVDVEVAALESANRDASISADVLINAEYINELEKEMLDAAAEYNFERAIELRDKIEELRGKIGQSVSELNESPRGKRGRRGKGGRSGRGLVPKPER